MENRRLYRTRDGGRWLCSTHMTSHHLLSLLPLYMHGWIPIADEYGARLKLMDAICLGKQSYLRQYFWSRLFSLFLSPSLSREESVSVISDIYSRDGSWGEHAQHSKAGTYQESGQFKGIWGIGALFSLIGFGVTVSFSLSLLPSCSYTELLSSVLA